MGFVRPLYDRVSAVPGLKARALAALIALVLIALLLTAGQGLASGGGEIMRVRFGGDATHTRVVIDLTGRVEGQLIEGDRARPSRMTLALVGARPSRDVAPGPGRGLVRSYDVDAVAGATRVRLELNGPAVVERRFLLPPGDGVPHFRYVIDLRSGRASGSVPQGATAQPPAEPRPQAVPPPASRAPAAAPQPARNSLVRTIVIDAGHGGRDPGAQGVSARESAITLAAALDLKRELERRGGYRVVLTRESDVYVGLEQRVRIARQANADLFISLHADAGSDPTTRGASVYTLSEQGAQRAVRQVTNREDWFRDMRLPGRDPSVDRILLDLTQRATQNRSAIFARSLLTEVEGSGHPMLRRSHRDAGFAVLLAPDVPAVLLEMGFITNVDDERLLSDPRQRQRLMGAVAASIDRYFADSGTDMMIAGSPAGGSR